MFLSAALLFAVQPMAAKQILPILGGSPAVWITAMLFFQAVLLAGYAYAHGACKLLPGRRILIAHTAIVALPLLTIPLVLPQSDPPEGSPVAWLILTLALYIGAPLFALTATAPLLQRWLAMTDHRRAANPYFLYAASNVGSLLALLAYPVIVERTMTMSVQETTWSAGYALFALGMVASAALIAPRIKRPDTGQERATNQPAESSAPERITWKRRAFWLLLAFTPSSLMLGVTQYITTDLAAVPLLWVIPLALYLLTFVIAFSFKGDQARAFATRLLPLLAVGMSATLMLHITRPIVLIVSLHLVFLFFAALACHGRLAATRPHASKLTEFYLIMSIGGVLGGAFNAVIAPLIFNTLVEYPIAIVLACLLPGAGLFQKSISKTDLFIASTFLFYMAVITVIVSAVDRALADPDSGALPVAWDAASKLLTPLIPALFLLTLHKRPYALAWCLGVMLMAAHLGGERLHSALHIERTFHGVLFVEDRYIDRDGEIVPWRRDFSHGTTQHGAQWLEPERRDTPIGYYHPDGPIGEVFAAFEDDPRRNRVGLVGLGVGALLAYAPNAANWTIYEIDPAVVRIASDEELFTFVSSAQSRADITFAIGDGRRKLSQAEDGSYGLIVLDAFSSDAVPVHLLTREAIAMYTRKLRSDGVLAFHISNQHLDLRPVVAAAARDLGLPGLERFDNLPRDVATFDQFGRWPSRWIVLSQSPAALQAIASEGPTDPGDPGAWTPLLVYPGDTAWTDDFSNILGVFRW